MATNKILRWSVIGGLYLIPFIPLIVADQSYFPFITGKNFAFRSLIEILFALWIILALRDKTYRPKFSSISWAVVALLVVSTLATIFSVNPYRSFWSNYERMGGLISLLHVGAYFVVLISFLRSKLDWLRLALVNLGANWIIIVYGLLQLAGKLEIHQGGVRLDATLGNAAYLAVYLLLNIFVVAYLAFNSREVLWRILFIITGIFDFILLYYTATRGALLGLVAGVLFSLSLFVFLAKGKLRNFSLGLLIILFALGGVFWLAKDSNFVTSSPVLSRFANISVTEVTTQSRFLIWRMSLQGFKENPVLGWGPENYSQVFAKYYNPLMWRQEPWFDRSHNIFLDWLIDAGLLGLLAYLSLFATAFYSIWKFRSKLSHGAYVLAGLLVAYLFQNIFVFDNLISFILFFSLLAYLNNLDGGDEGGINTDVKQLKNYKQIKKQDTNDSALIPVISVVIVIILFGGLYYFNYQPYVVSRDLIKAIHPQLLNPEQSLEMFTSIFERKTFGSGEAREQLINKSYGILSNPQVSNETKVAFAKLVDEQAEQHLLLYKEDARSNLLLGSFYSVTNRPVQGFALLKQASALSPNKQQILIELASAYVRSEDAPMAMATAKQAYELAPEYPEARKIYAIISFLVGQDKLGQELIKPIKDQPEYYQDNRFINVYRELGRNDLLQEIVTLQEKNKK